jgi:hypothetical protein
MSGILYVIFYNTQHTIDKLSVLIHATSFEQAIDKAEKMLAVDGIMITGVERVV